MGPHPAAGLWRRYSDDRLVIDPILQQTLAFWKSCFSHINSERHCYVLIFALIAAILYKILDG
jgi:hypothetical protein